jgi:prepilin-type N-terminal cleavage/methylation domain-containing protein
MDSKYTGFTLIELLVVIAIIGILAATAIVNFGKNDDRDVRAEKDRLTSFIREVQNKALAGDKSNIPMSVVKVCGFGVRGVSDGAASLQIYYIVGAGVDTDCSDTSTTPNVFSSSPTLDTFYLKNDVKVDGSFSDVFFLSPNGNIYYGGSDNASAFPITISLKKGSITSIPVNIDQSGRIY